MKKERVFAYLSLHDESNGQHLRLTVASWRSLALRRRRVLPGGVRLRLHLHVLREGVGVVHVWRETPDRGWRRGVGVHGVGGRGLIIVKVCAAVDRWLRRVLLLLLV